MVQVANYWLAGSGFLEENTAGERQDAFLSFILKIVRWLMRVKMLRSVADLFDTRKAERMECGMQGKAAFLAPRLKEYDVAIVGGGPAGLSAATFCGQKLLRTAVFEGNCWGGILTRYCPDKPIDNYPGVPKGILAKELAALLVEQARKSGADLIEQGVEKITPDRTIRTKDLEVAGKVLVLACGSNPAEAGIPGEKEFASGRGVHYRVYDPSSFRGLRVVVLGGGDTAISHVQRLLGVAERVTLVHRKPLLRSAEGLSAEVLRAESLDVLLNTVVEEILGTSRVEGVRLRQGANGQTRNLPAEAVIVAAGRVPNSVLFRNLGLALDSQGQIVTEYWQKTNLPRILAIGDVTARLKMIITAVAQAAVAAHEAHAQIYWKG
jgi:thioredoxin reductase (NADPH)